MAYEPEKGIHPAVGVILMVAITVVLAAAIAGFIFSMAGNFQHDPDPFNQTVTITITDKGFTDSQGFFIDGLDKNGFKRRIFLFPEDGYKISKFEIGDSYRFEIRRDYYIPEIVGTTNGWRMVSVIPLPPPESLNRTDNP
jgi:flagellin-like protein